MGESNSENPPEKQRINFTSSPARTVGVELELSVVDRETRELAPMGPQLLEKLSGNPMLHNGPTVRLQRRSWSIRWQL